MKVRVCIARSQREYANPIVEAPSVEIAEAYVESLLKSDTDDSTDMVNNVSWDTGSETFDEEVIDSEEYADQDEEPDVTVPADWVAPAEVSPDPDENWQNSTIQFPRLLAELEAILRPDDYVEVAASMDLPVERVHELMTRAQAEWDRIKEQTR